MTKILRVRLAIASAVVLATWMYVWTLNHFGTTYLDNERILAVRLLEVFISLHWLILALPALGIWKGLRRRWRKKLLLYVAPELLISCALFWVMTAHGIWIIQITTSHDGALKKWRMLEQEGMMQNFPSSEEKWTAWKGVRP